MNIQHIAVADLKPAAYNPRKISRDMLKTLIDNIREFGLVDPIVVNTLDFQLACAHFGVKIDEGGHAEEGRRGSSALWEANVDGYAIIIWKCGKLSGNIPAKAPGEVSCRRFSRVGSEDKDRDALDRKARRSLKSNEMIIAENVRLKSRLEHAEDKLGILQRIIDAMPLFIAYVDKDFRYRVANRAHEGLFSRNQHDIMGRQVREVLGDTAWKVVRPFGERALAGESVSYERELVFSDKVRRWCHVTHTPDRDASGKVSGFVVLVHDISLIKTAQKALTQSETKYRAYVDHSPVGVLVASAAGQCEEANPTAEAMLGCVEGQLLKTRFLDLCLPEDGSAVEHLFTEVCEKGFAAAITRLCRCDGKMIWTSIQAVKVDDDRILAILQDLTSWLQAEEALCHKKAQLQVILDATADGILAVDSKGKVIEANKRFTDLWKIPQSLLGTGVDAEMLNFVLDQLVDPDAFIRKVNNLYGTAEPALDTLLFKDGRIFERYSAPLWEDGRPAGRVWSFRDITARKEAEESLKRSKQEVEESNSALRVLLKQREQDREELEQRFLANVKQLVLPYVELLKGRSMPPEVASLLNTLRTNLIDMTSSFAVNLSQKLVGLTTKEILVADLVKDGRQDKDIASLLNLSVDTVKVHRRNIRKKLGIKGQKTNLRTYLASVFSK